MPYANNVPGHAIASGAGTFTALAAEAWGFLNHSTDVWLAGLASPEVIRGRSVHRLNTLVAHARRNSKFYRDLYQGLPPGRVPLEQLPIVNKSRLMANFDDWVTRPDLSLEALLQFTQDPTRIGRPYMGQYAIWTSSGTTGTPGIFVQDPQALAVYEALFAVRNGIDARAMLRSISGGGRFAFAAALEGHFSGITMWRRMLLLNPWMTRHTRAVSVLQPLHSVIEQLAEFEPHVLTSYASELVALAEQQREGRLALKLKGIWSGGETLSRRDRADIAGAFGCPVIDDYGASEFLNIAFDCGCGSLHVNRDWVTLEAVDRDGRPVPDGTASSTALLTNLANFIQPIIRYDLGDSITYLTEPCPCGSPLPALRVEGRRDDTICLQRLDGHVEPVIPLALCTAIEERAGVFRFQVVEEDANRLLLRIDPSEGNPNEVAARTEQCIRGFCAELGAQDVFVHTDPAPPQIDPVNGKLRRVCARARIPITA
ncbi:MAG TPA: phenylacetate--CoA ligase family protein [Burkholderiaceae bacterium]|jgi:phenylacetate-CoA ligase|nr:phenylacetate--CoA ligase family protein [Burkholderiaceae bacterium]